MFPASPHLTDGAIWVVAIAILVIAVIRAVQGQRARRALRLRHRQYVARVYRERL